jgi:hypothetical protein
MLRYYRVLTLWLFLVFQAVAQEASAFSGDPLDHPYVALLAVSGTDYSRRELKSLRAKIEQERDKAIESCKRDENRLRHGLDSAREQLQELNKSSSGGGSATAYRNALHTRIIALERVAHDKAREREYVIPATFEIKLAKVRLLEQWPDRREQIVREMRKGGAHKRRYGDVEDIGYRKLIEDQERDITVGQQAVRQMIFGGSMPLEIQDTAVRQYVGDLAAKIARNSDLKVPLHVAVVDSPEINCIGLPGGFLFVTSGLILAAQTESQLAGVVSRQVAHVAARHASRISKRSVIVKMLVPATQIAAGLLTGLSSKPGMYYGANYGFQALGTLADRTPASANGKYQQEADQLGIQYAWKAGFDPRGFIAFLDSIAKAKEYSKTGSFFRTTPALGKRLLDAFTEVQYLPPTAHYTVDSAQFQAAKQRLQEE